MTDVFGQDSPMEKELRDLRAEVERLRAALRKAGLDLHNEQRQREHAETKLREANERADQHFKQVQKLAGIRLGLDNEVERLRAERDEALYGLRREEEMHEQAEARLAKVMDANIGRRPARGEAMKWMICWLFGHDYIATNSYPDTLYKWECRRCKIAKPIQPEEKSAYEERGREVERLRAELKWMSDARTSWQESSMKAQYERGQALKRAEQVAARLCEVVEALEWMRNLASGVGKRGEEPDLGEHEAACDAADAALAAAQPKETKPHAFEWAPADQQESHCCRCGKGIEEHAAAQPEEKP